MMRSQHLTAQFHGIY